MEDINSLFYNITEEMSESQSEFSLWGPGQPLTTGYKPLVATTASHSNCSTPSTPPYSQSLELERNMLCTEAPAFSPSGSYAMTEGTRQQHPICRPPPPLIPASPVASSNKRARGKSFVDPCLLAPRKKRMIQLAHLNPDEREKVLHKREKNKVAAEKCRVKRRENVQRIRSDYDECLEASEELEAQIRSLKEEHQLLQQLLENHHCVLTV